MVGRYPANGKVESAVRKSASKVVPMKPELVGKDGTRLIMGVIKELHLIARMARAKGGFLNSGYGDGHAR